MMWRIGERTAEVSDMDGTYGQVLGSSAGIETRAHEMLDALGSRAASSQTATAAA